MKKKVYSFVRLEMITGYKLINMLLVLLILGGGTFCRVYAAIQPYERAALIALYNSTNGDNWTNHDGWKDGPLHTDGFAMPGKENNWHGISCDEGNTAVLSIKMGNNNLNGSIPAEIGNLANLQDLFLYNNELIGTIPTEIGNLANLARLYLYNNKLAGAIPAEIGNLANLQDLFLSNNELIGTIPTEIGNLANLTHLYLYRNKLAGAIPAELGNLTNLQHLNLAFNELIGAIPEALANPISLKGIDLSDNHLSGAIPEALGNLINLEYLWLTDNELIGAIPAKLGNLTNLIQLYLYRNKLAGAIPEALGNLINIEYLFLYDNELIGAIPAKLGNLISLKMLDLSNNHLSGAIPGALGNPINLQWLFLYDNELIGPIPAELGNLIRLQNLNLSNNDLSGAIPAALGNLTNLERLDFSGNHLSGAIPETLGNLTNLRALGLTKNELSGVVPEELGNLTHLKELDLSDNYLSGAIPAALGNLTNLERLYLDSNELSGVVPEELGNLINLFLLNLVDNKLSGAIPEDLGNLTNLRALGLTKNELSGTIPAELGNLTNLQDLDLSFNQLSGAIPEDLGNLANLQYLDLIVNQLSGAIPAELGNLTNLRALGLTKNELSGTIPAELGNLTNLQDLDLSFNQLSGAIPAELGNLTNLTSFDLSYNQLSGAIPTNLTSLNSLAYFNIDYNALYTDDDILRTFLESKAPGWENTQTIAPKDVEINDSSQSSIEISWVPISYKEDSGAYIVLYSMTSGGPYTLFDTTTDKLVRQMEVTGLNADTAYYLVVQTRTDPHGYNQNTVYSEYSEEVSATTTPSCAVAIDADMDGHYTPESCVTPADDCDDNNPEIWECNTPVGEDVTIMNDTGKVTVTFPSVVGGGDTIINAEECEAPPEGLTLAPYHPICVEITTDASFEGEAQICISYVDEGLSISQQLNLKMVRCDPNGNCDFIPCDPPIHVDTVKNIVCGCSDHFSIFAIGIPKDSDGDLTPDLLDNCPDDYNIWQEDIDKDGNGDACDNCPDFYDPTNQCKCLQMSLPANWSMISLPVVPKNSTSSILFPDATVIYGYQKGIGYRRFEGNDPLQPGKGYWILLPEAQTYSLTGQSIKEYPTSIDDGWFMIGGCTFTAKATLNIGEIVVIYSYEQGTGYQRISDFSNIDPGKGYWILFKNINEQSEFRVTTEF